jgi:ubiquinone/menaquinone biosynthesis C-methylase UbiE
VSDPRSNLPPAPPEFYSRDYFLASCSGHTEFAASGGRVSDPIREAALAMSRPAPGRRLLDLGCGRGEVLAAMSLAGAVAAGVDFSTEALAIARNTASRLGAPVLLVRARAESLPFRGGVFDTVLATDIVEHLPEPDLRCSVAEVHRCLKPAGRFVVHTAPTRAFLAVGQHVKRLLQWLTGQAVAPRLTYDSELRAAGHSNLHSRRTLAVSLTSAFPSVRAWYSFSDGTRWTRRLATSLGLASLLGFNLWALATKEERA